MKKGIRITEEKGGGKRGKRRWQEIAVRRGKGIERGEMTEKKVDRRDIDACR